MRRQVWSPIHSKICQTTETELLRATTDSIFWSSVFPVNHHGCRATNCQTEVGSLATKPSDLSISEIELEKRAATNAGSLTGKIKELPEHFTFKEHERPTVAHDDYSELEIPVIDLTGLSTKDEAQMSRIANEVCLALEDWGFFQVYNHGIPAYLTETIRQRFLSIFALPLEQKLAQESAAYGKTFYSGYGTARPVTNVTAFSWQEAFTVISAPNYDLPELLGKIWSHEKVREFCQPLEEWREYCWKLSVELLCIAAQGLGVTPPHYKQFTDLAAGTVIRGNYYPPCPDPMKTLGIHTHCDSNTMTILYQGDVGGLQVARGDKWVGVRPIANGFAVNAGDLLQAMSNGRYKSVLHRAVTNKDQARTSIACFSHPRLDATITVAPELVYANHPAIYRPFGWLEYREIRLRRGSEYKRNALELFLVDQETQSQQNITSSN